MLKHLPVMLKHLLVILSVNEESHALGTEILRFTQNDNGGRMTEVADSSFFVRCVDKAVCGRQWANLAFVFDEANV